MPTAARRTRLCIDVTQAPFTPLATVSGSVAVKTAHDTVVLVRTTATDVVALSAICTHQGCTVAYKSASNLLVCPCHGAEYALSGAVVRSPATRALKLYVATLSGNDVTVTLV